jgi:hypothetical protein
MAKYMIFEGFIGELEKKMRQVEKKCARYGVAFVYRQTGAEEYRDIKDNEGTLHKLRFVEVEAEGKAQMGDWMWLASVEHTAEGNLIHSPRDITVPTKYYTSDGYCEHCNSNRARRYLYLVGNVKTHEVRQVGRTCVRDYTHGLNAEMIALCASMNDMFAEAEERIPGFGFGFNCFEYYDVEMVVRFMCETIRLFGYVPKGQDDNWATAARAEAYMNVALGHARFFYDLKQYEAAKQEMEKVGFDANSAQATADAQAALAWIMEQDDSRSTWTHNLKTLVKLGEVTTGQYPILASLIPAWNKSLAREAERKAKAAAVANSKHVGEVGDRITFEVASTEIVTSWATDYGMAWLVKFVSKDGNVFMWRASSLNALPDDFAEIKAIKGTVKSHDEFRGVKQTFLSRCKPEEVKPANVAKHKAYNPTAEIALNEAIEALS